MPARNVQFLFLAVAICLVCHTQAERMRYAGKISNALKLINESFIEEVDANELVSAAMNGMVSKLDRFSEYIPPSRYDEFQAVIEQQFGGLGVLIEGPPVVRQLTVVSPIPGTPAFAAGIEPGDVIVDVGGQTTEGLSAADASALMRGPVGERIELTLKRPGVAELFVVNIARADIQIDSVYGDRIRTDSSWDYFLEEDSRIAYIRVTLFGDRTLKEFQDALQAIQPQAKAVIIDLRYNPGGILPTAVKMCDMLVEEGTIVSTRGRHEAVGMTLKATTQTLLDPSLPMVVLINDQSASASEIMAGCLQDLGRAKIAGSRSYGKGTVQQVFSLDNDTSALKFTTARFYRPSGKNIHRTDKMTELDVWGVSPQPELNFPMSDYESLYLNRRWRQNGDPRLTAASEQPPSPAFAGDPQLHRVVEYLQRQLDANR